MNNKQNGHIISHTHWDREWRVPEWNARWRLGVMMDRLLEKLKDNPDFIFLFDGQVVSIEDYLELYPARRDEIVEYVKQGRLNIGPWYNLPDLYPVSGETLIRNLLIGRERAQRFGGCLDIAYTTFGWGQTAQFPQIFDGFGIKRIVCAKNVSKQRAPNSEFYWQSPDGTRVFTTRLGVEKRANFYFFTLMPVLYGSDYKDLETRLHWGKDGWFWHSADSNTESELSLIPLDSFHDEVLDKALNDAWDTCRDTLAPGNLFMGNGCDSTAPNDVVDKIIEIANASDDRKLFYSSLERYFDEIEKEIENKGIELKTVHGELRDGPVHSLSANALAARMPLKSLNRAAQNSLVRYGEPLAALAFLWGIGYPQSFIDKGWHFLLLAHSHDALNGVTLEKTARDTQNKFEQVCEIGQVVTDMSAVELLKQVDMSSCADDDIMLAVFNPSPSPKRHVTHAVIDVPQEINCRYLTATDTDGSSLAVQPVDHVSRQLPVCVQNSRALPFYADRHTMYIDTGTIPPLGYKIIKLGPGEQYSRETKFWLPSYEYGSQVCGVNRMANEYLDISINNDGTFNVRDKTTGQIFENLGSFEDGGDAGDYWQRLVPSHDRVYSSLGKEANIYLAIDGSLVTSYVCETIMKIPASVIKESQFKSCRSNEMTEMKLKTTLTLKAGSRYLEVDVEVDNNARDHRLRMCMPTFVDTDTSDAQGHFNVDSRTIGRDYVNGKRDGGMSTLPMQNFVDLAGEKRSFAVLNKDLIEFEVSEDESRTLYLTLLRCVGIDICTEGRCGTTDSSDEGAQCLGTHRFSLAVCPHKGNWIDAKLYSAVEEYTLSPRMYQVSKANEGRLPMDMSLLEVSNPDVQLAAVKKAQREEGIVIRIYNPTQSSQSCDLKLAGNISKAFKTDMNEEKQQELNLDGNTISLDLGPCKIVTVLIEV